MIFEANVSPKKEMNKVDFTTVKLGDKERFDK